MSSLGELDSPVLEDLEVLFNPQLYLQRQAWILQQLRGESVDSVLDVGCGSGDLFSCLCEPAQTVRSDAAPGDPILDIFEDLHLSKVAGIDLCAESIEAASTHVVKRIENTINKESPWLQVRNRWEPFEAKLWQGSLDNFNPEFVYDPSTGTGYEAIVAQEVIEHLPPDVFDKFAPVLLGAYRPKMLLITTPSYDFNQRFTAPGTMSPGGYPDPTNRTTRVFRHSDHKLEFTRAEFLEYCEQSAARFGYTVRVDCIGSPLQEDPYASVRNVGRATQVAVFMRNPAGVCEPPGVIQQCSILHVLCQARVFSVHPGPRLDHSEILDLVQRYLIDSSDAVTDLHCLWYWAEGVAVACGGDLRILVRALLSNNMDWIVENPERIQMETKIEWLRFVPSPQVAQTFDSAWEISEISSNSSYPASEWGDVDPEVDALASSMLSTGSGWETGNDEWNTWSTASVSWE